MLKTLLITLLSLTLVTPSVLAGQVIYLVRHAEKQTGKNPHLTPAGIKRANSIANLLKQADISTIYSTDYHRTQQTAKPLAKQNKLKVKSYDPRQLPAFATQVKQVNGNIMVVGHSNTTPQLVRLLGGKATDMDESEYTRLYQLFIDNGGKVTTVLLSTTP